MPRPRLVAVAVAVAPASGFVPPSFAWSRSSTLTLKAVDESLDSALSRLLPDDGTTPAPAAPLNLDRDDNAAWLAACEDAGVVSWYDAGLRLTDGSASVLGERAPSARGPADRVLRAEFEAWKSEFGAGATFESFERNFPFDAERGLFEDAPSSYVAKRNAALRAAAGDAAPSAAPAAPPALAWDDTAAWLDACEGAGVVSWFDAGLRLTEPRVTAAPLERPPALDEPRPAAAARDDAVSAQECCDAMNLNHVDTLARVASARNRIKLEDIESIRAIAIDGAHLLIEAMTVDGPFANMHAVPVDVPDECVVGQGISTACLVAALETDVSARGATNSNGGEACEAFSAGNRVNARYRGGDRWYPGVIARRDERDGTYAIDYDDGDYEEGVLAALIEAQEVELALEINQA